MAISAGTVLRAYEFQNLRQDSYTNTDEYEVLTCKVDVEYTTTAYATADDSTFAPGTVIQNTLRDGNTVTILQACVVAGGQYSLSAAPTTYYLAGAGACSNSAGTVTNALLAEDWSTEMTNATALNTATWQKPITYQVTFRRKLVGE